MSKPVLIGQAPGPRTDPELPLYPLPRTSAGGRLQEMMGISRGTYLKSFIRLDLLGEFPGRWRLDDKFPMGQAKAVARTLRPLLEGREVVFVGRQVALAFGFAQRDLSFLEWGLAVGPEFRCSVVPHPSGRNHWYNHPENRERARRFWEEFLTKQGLVGADLGVLPFSK